MSIEPSINEDERLGRAAIEAWWAWEWMPGMMAIELETGWKQRVNAVNTNNVVSCNSMHFLASDKNFIPDLSDTTTLDCLRGLVLRAYAGVIKFSIYADSNNSVNSSLPPKKAFVRVEVQNAIAYIQGRNETEVLVNALKSSPKE